MHDDVLKREDIYRQRVFGNNSAAKQFIEVEERRKVKPQWLLLYLLFAVATWKYSTQRLHVAMEYDVYEAIRKPFDTTVFTSSPQPRRWKDIDSMKDVKAWLLYAFPDIMSPEVQHFNIPVGTIRFTMRRIQMENNTDKRFNDYYKEIWKNPNGIHAESRKDDDDDKDSFGAYRVWANVSLDWSYLKSADKRCPSDKTWIDMVRFPEGMGELKIEQQCRQWCEQLIRPLTCHCFEQSAATGTCDFYQVGDSGFTLATDSAIYTENRDSDPSVIIPTLELAPKHLSLWAMFPLMKRFKFASDKKGYRKTPGFIQFLTYYSQAQLMAMGAQKNTAPSSSSHILSNEIEDWIAGGYMDKRCVTLSVDFATYNPNYDMFSWVQLVFSSTASGFVNKKININSIRIIKSKELENQWSLGDEFDNVWEIIYLGLVCFYVSCEVWEMTCCAKGLKYFTSTWNWLTLMHLLLNLVTIGMWLGYKGQTEFINELIEMQKASNPAFGQSNLISFAEQSLKYTNFKVAAAFNMLFLAMQLLQYLNDIYPRVTVLVETVTDSFVPIFFFTLVCCCIIFGTIMWTFVWFGRRLADFSSFQDAVVTVVAMTVGEVRAFTEVRREYGVVSFLFYIPYQLFMIIVVFNFPRAVLNAGYADASVRHDKNLEHEQKRLAAKESQGSDGAFRILKAVKLKLKALLPEELGAKGFMERVRKHQSMTVQHRKSYFALYTIYCVLYTVMCVLIMRTSRARHMTSMVEQAIKLNTFSKFNGITGQAVRGSNFDTISNRHDVNKWLEQVLPTTLYMTSRGSFDGVRNPLLNYSSAPAFKQLVVSNWNIMVGQKPVRMTVKMHKTKALGNDAINGVVSRDYRLRDSSEKGEQVKVSDKTGLPDSNFVPEELYAGIENNISRKIIEKYCNYTFGYGAKDYDTLNGFVCMLDVNQLTTRTMLTEMSQGLITEHTATLTLEFVLYNAWAETFVYNSIRFGFQPSGLIWKDVEVQPISLELHVGLGGTFLVVLEIIVLVLNTYYLLQNLFELFKALLSGWRGEGKESQKKMPGKLKAVLREFIYFFLLDGFNAVDFVSCVATLVTMIMFYNYTNSPLSQFYFFQEEPGWVKGKCLSQNFEWCSDSEVITQFSAAKDTFKTFSRVCAINTIAVFMRLLRYLKTFKHMAVIFSTIISGLEDILWFVVVFFVALVGYMFAGHIVFGANSEDFKSPWNALRACFEIFLGTFDSQSMANFSLVIMIIYVLTFWFVFKLIVVNMFLAIIDKNYNFIDEKRVREDKLALLNSESRTTKQPPGWAKTQLANLKDLFTGAPDKGEDSPAPEKVEESTPVLPASAEGEAGTGTPTSPAAAEADTGGSGDMGLAAAAEEPARISSAPVVEKAAEVPVQKFEKEHVKNPNWKQLPEEVRDWSLEKANFINGFIHELLDSRQKLGGDDKEAEALEGCLQKAETKIGEMKKAWAQDSNSEKRNLDEQELEELRKVHQDQESLSWYIMKRDAELKKLESAKELKQDRFDKMVKAANSLIKPDEDGQQGGDQMALMNR